MTMESLRTRSGDKCEVCSSSDSLSVYEVSPLASDLAETLLCEACISSINANEFSNDPKWHCLGESIWNENSAVKVLSYSILTRLRGETWAQDLLEQIYLEPQELEWAKERSESIAPSTDQQKPTVDSNGTALQEGDSVTLIKDLDVKGGGFTAKRGTMVKNIRLTNNPEHIEGKVNGVQIVLVAKFLKKA